MFSQRKHTFESFRASDFVYTPSIKFRKSSFNHLPSRAWAESFRVKSSQSDFKASGITSSEQLSSNCTQNCQFKLVSKHPSKSCFFALSLKRDVEAVKSLQPFFSAPSQRAKGNAFSSLRFRNCTQIYFRSDTFFFKVLHWLCESSSDDRISLKRKKVNLTWHGRVFLIVFIGARDQSAGF